MKTAHVLGALSLLSLAVATPFPNDVQKRDSGDVTEAVVVTEVVVEEGPSVLVYVDDEGHTISVVTKDALKTEYKTAVHVVTQTPAAPAPVVTPTTAPAPAAPTPVVQDVAPVQSSAAPAVAAPAPAPAAASPAAAAPSPAAPASAPSTGSSTSSGKSTAGSAGLTDFKGIVYSPYNGNYGSSSCKSAAQVAQDFASMPSGYNMIRLYGVDCDQVASVAPVAAQYGMKLFLGVYNVAGGAYKADLESMASQLNNDWSNVHTVVIGNELVSGGAISVSELVAAVDDVKTNILNGAGPYVVTVDTFSTTIANPQLCEASDYTAVNMHPYYDPNTSAATAGDFMTQWMGTVRNACPSGQPLVISETGWPWAGQSHDIAVPSPADQATAISAIEGAVGQGYILLAAFNEYWIAPGMYGIDQFFGIYGEAPSDNATPIS